MGDLAVGRESDIQVGKLQKNCPWQEFRDECRRDSGPFAPAHLLGFLQARPSFVIGRNEGDLLKDTISLHPFLDVPEFEVLPYVWGDPEKEIEEVRAVAAEKRSGERENLPGRLAEMVQGDALGRGRVFVFVALVRDEEIEISRVLVLEISGQGETPGTTCVRRPQGLAAVPALLLFPIESFLGYRDTVPVHQ